MSALVGLKQASRPKYEMLADVHLGVIRVDFAVSGLRYSSTAGCCYAAVHVCFWLPTVKVMPRDTDA